MTKQATKTATSLGYKCSHSEAISDSLDENIRIQESTCQNLEVTTQNLETPGLSTQEELASTIPV